MTTEIAQHTDEEIANQHKEEEDKLIALFASLGYSYIPEQSIMPGIDSSMIFHKDGCLYGIQRMYPDEEELESILDMLPESPKESPKESPTKIHSWVKKIGERHYSINNDSETLCGRPMLGNNYDLVRPDAPACPECVNVALAKNLILPGRS